MLFPEDASRFGRLVSKLPLDIFKISSENLSLLQKSSFWIPAECQFMREEGPVRGEKLYIHVLSCHMCESRAG